MAAAPPAGSRWLYGPLSDLSLGSGLLYIPIFLLLVAIGGQLPFGPVLVGMLLFSTPHLGATLLRVYERAEDRRAYSLFAVHGTIGIVATTLLALYLPWIGSLLITVYFTIVPWHFTGQNYGIALVFLRRHGVEIPPGVKRFIYAAFAIPYAMWMVALHGAQPATAEYAPLQTAETVYRFLPVGLPVEVQGVLLLVAAIGYVYALGGCALYLRDLASARDLLPTAALLLTQGLWFAAPVLTRIWIPVEKLGPLSPENAAQTFMWVSILHGLQYLWIASYYARREHPRQGPSRFLLKSLLAGSAVYGVPMLVLAPGILGRLPYDAGLYLLVAGALNIHHVMMDGVIWKLRNARIAKILIRGVVDEAPAAGPPRSRWPWLRPLIWASGALGVVFSFVGDLEVELGVRRALERGDVVHAERAAQRLAWMGRDSEVVRARLGSLWLARGDRSAALRAFERSVALRPTPAAWLQIGRMREREGDVESALQAYQTALELDPQDATALHHAKRAALQARQIE